MSTYAELVYRARAGDPEAIQILGWGGPAPQEPYAPDPYLQQSMMNMFLPMGQFTDEGEPEWQKNLNLQQDVISEQADPVTAGLVGSAGLAPGVLDPTPTWEPMETPTRSELERYRNGTGWQGYVARALLDWDMTPEDAIAAAEVAAADGEFKLPTARSDNPFSSAEPETDYQTITQWAQDKFEGLAREGDPSLGEEAGLTRWNDAAQMWERQGEPEPSPLAEKYASLGLPLPTDEYSMDWARTNMPGITQPIDQRTMDVHARNSEQAAMARAAMAERNQNRENREAYQTDQSLQGIGVNSVPHPPGVQEARSIGAASGDFEYRQYDPLSSSFAPTLSVGGDTRELPSDAEGWGNSELQGQEFLNRMYNEQQAGIGRTGLLDSLRPRGGVMPPGRETKAQEKFNDPAQTRRRANNRQEQHSAMMDYDKQAIAMYLLAQQGRTPYRDAMQARTQPMMQAGSMPPWGG